MYITMHGSENVETKIHIYTPCLPPSDSQAASESLKNQNSTLMFDLINFIRDNLHSTFYSAARCSRHQDLLQLTSRFKKTL